MKKTALLVCSILGSSALVNGAAPYLYRQVDIPEEYRATLGDRPFGGDLRIGDLDGDGSCEFVIYRSAQGGTIRQHDGGTKPCFIAAFDLDGNPLWQQGEGGEQPVRPGPVAVYDFDGDGRSEIVCLWHRPIDGRPTDWLSLSDVSLQIRDGGSGRVLRERRVPEIAAIQAPDPKKFTWPHQRILIANFRGLDRPRDLLVKAGDTYVALTDELEVLWTYRFELEGEGRFPPKFPAVGDMDGDGRDETYGGYFLLSPEGIPHWKLERATYMDSVAIDVWDSGNVRAIGSGAPHVMGIDMDPILNLGDELIPHGQELRVANFSEASPGPEMAVRSHGHDTRLAFISMKGDLLGEFDLNEVPNNTGMESVYLNGFGQAALLVCGDRLWDLEARSSIPLSGVPEASGKKVHRMGFYHAIPAELTGDGAEDLVLYDPASTQVYIYTADTSASIPSADFSFESGPRQYNPRLMD